MSGTFPGWADQDKIMQLSSDIEKSVKWKQCSSHSSKVKCVAASRSCWGN